MTKGALCRFFGERLQIRCTIARRAKGYLHEYANAAFAAQEKQAWANHVIEKYDNI
jgi:hypothetical protein